jgi:hypothetical protein
MRESMCVKSINSSIDEDDTLCSSKIIGDANKFLSSELICPHLIRRLSILSEDFHDYSNRVTDIYRNLVMPFHVFRFYKIVTGLLQINKEFVFILLFFYTYGVIIV